MKGFRIRYTWTGFCRMWFALTGVDLSSKVKKLMLPGNTTEFQDGEFDFVMGIQPLEDTPMSYELSLWAYKEANGFQWADVDNWIEWNLGTYRLPHPDYSTLKITNYYQPEGEDTWYPTVRGNLLDSSITNPFGEIKLQHDMLYLIMGLGKLRQGNITVSQFVGSLQNYGYKCDKVKFIADGITGEVLFQPYDNEGNPIGSMRSVLKHITEFRNFVRLS